MVDAGYLLRQSVEIVSGRASTKRHELEITDPAGLIKALLDKCNATLDQVSKELLRVYWYDGVMATGYTPQQRSLIELPDVNFRAGTVNRAGQQKGVDSLIVTDLIELASNHAICNAALVTGDSDLAIGIEIAQKKGVRIAVIGVEDLSVGVSHKQSFEITSRADRVGRLGGAELRTVMRYVPQQAVAPQPTAPVPVPTSAQANAPQAEEQRIEQAVKEFIAQQAEPHSLTAAIDPSTKRIDSAVDRALIHHVFITIGRKLTNPEKIHARAVLRTEVGASRCN